LSGAFQNSRKVFSASLGALIENPSPSTNSVVISTIRLAIGLLRQAVIAWLSILVRS
jgi:hypothetical protein